MALAARRAGVWAPNSGVVGASGGGCHARSAFFAVCARRFFLAFTFAFFADGGQWTANGNFLPFTHENFQKRSVIKIFQFHGCLIGFNFRQDITIGNFITCFFVPFYNGPH